MPRNLKRHYGKGDLHFITFSCYERRPLLGTIRARNVFVRFLGKVRGEYGFLLVGYVLMPEHVHLWVKRKGCWGFSVAITVRLTAQAAAWSRAGSMWQLRNPDAAPSLRL